MWSTTEAAAWAVEQSAVTQALAAWPSGAALAETTATSTISAALATAQATFTNLQQQAEQAYADYMATLEPGETPTVAETPIVTQVALLNNNNAVTLTAEQVAALQQAIASYA